MDLPIQLGSARVYVSNGQENYYSSDVNQLANRLRSKISGITTQHSQHVAEMAINSVEHRELSYSFKILHGNAEMSHYQFVSKRSGSDIHINWYIFKAIVPVIVQRSVSQRSCRRRFLVFRRCRCRTSIENRGISTAELYGIQNSLTAVITSDPMFKRLN